VVPRRILESFGNWYVQGDDSASGEMRTFRIDRIDALSFTGRTVPVIEMDDNEETWFADATEFVTLSVAPKARWIVEQYPYVERKESSDGRIVVTMAVTSEHWLGRLLLRAGTDAHVVEPAKWVDLAARTARSVLAKYEV
jgi:proteasome accessory factor C